MNKTVRKIRPPRGEVDFRNRRSRFASWRAGTLILVYVLMTAHVVHWMIAGKTLAPLELNEVTYTLELGIVTAGFLFMLMAMLATAIFGRFFCSWGCHILALQDLCSWILDKLRIRPRAIRSRALLWVPIVAAGYMFLWPQVVRLWQGRDLPLMHVRTDDQGWASFMTEDYWRNLPGPGIALLTFAVVGVLIVYVLGSRSFCAYGCPYGAVFGILDRMAPGRIRAKAPDACADCGICTAVCTSHVRVHEELQRHAMVVNPACLKDLDCVAACPKGNAHFGFGLPAILKSVHVDTPIRTKYDFTLAEELVLVVVFLIVLITFRGLYGKVPFFLSMGLGVIAAVLTVQLIRLVRRPAMQWNRWQLKSHSGLAPMGWAYVAATTVFWAFVVHSAVIHYHSFRGTRYAAATSSASNNGESAMMAIEYFEFARRWGLWANPQDDVHLADAHYHLAGGCFKNADPSKAESHLRAALHVHPSMTMAHYDLGALLVQKGELSGGIHHLRVAISTKPDFAEAHYNLALALWMAGTVDDARREIDTAHRLKPSDEQTAQLRTLMHQR